MKAFVRQFIYVGLVAASIISCKKPTDPEPEPVSQIVFWSTNKNIEKIKVDCYVDGKKIGTLNKLNSSAPDCSDSKSPVATVEPGDHYCEFRAANGQTIDVELTTEHNKCYNIELE